MRKVLKELRENNPKYEFKSGLFSIVDNVRSIFFRRKDTPKKYNVRTNTGGWMFYSFLSDIT